MEKDINKIIEQAFNAHKDGNVANRKGIKLQEVKWSGKDFALAGDDKLPMGKAITEWSYGDVDSGFKKAKVVVEETFVSAAQAHHALEPRSAAAYWENGKCHVWGSTQSSSFAHPSLAKYIGIPPTKNGEKQLLESGIRDFVVKTRTDDGVAVAWQGPFFSQK